MNPTLEIPAEFMKTVEELVKKAETTGVDRDRVRLCAGLLVIAQSRPESDFPRGKDVPIPNYDFVGAMHEIDNGDEHPEEVARLYAEGRYASRRVRLLQKAH